MLDSNHYNKNSLFQYDRDLRGLSNKLVEFVNKNKSTKLNKCCCTHILTSLRSIQTGQNLKVSDKSLESFRRYDSFYNVCKVYPEHAMTLTSFYNLLTL